MNSFSSPSQQADLQALRTLLKQRFPEARPTLTDTGSATDVEEAFRTGVPALDAAGVPPKGLIELTGTPSSGISLVIWAVIRQRLLSGHAVALVDSSDSADAARAWPGTLTSRLLWVRCSHAKEALLAMDLLVRDGNIRHLVMDLQGNTREPRSSPTIPQPLWYRLRNVAEDHGCGPSYRDDYRHYHKLGSNVAEDHGCGPSSPAIDPSCPVPPCAAN